MYQLGTLVESWYGSAQFVFIYGMIGSFGNLIAVLIRSWNGWGPRVHSGGGSVVILGLVGLCAVVGWRVRTRVGSLLYRQMLGVLALTAIIGLALPRYIDNWGHAGGALVGAFLGLGHGALVHGISKPRAIGAGVLTGVAILICGAAQAVADRREAPARMEASAAGRAVELERVLQGLAGTRRLAKAGGDVKKMHSILAMLDRDIDRPTRAEIRRLKVSLEGSQPQVLESRRRQMFLAELDALIARVQTQYRTARRQLAEIRRAPGYRPGTVR
jgi:hypothetical protein